MGSKANIGRVCCALLTSLALGFGATGPAEAKTKDTGTILSSMNTAGSFIVLSRSTSAIVGQHLAIANEGLTTSLASFTDPDQAVLTMPTPAATDGSSMPYVQGLAVFNVEDAGAGAIYLRHKDLFLASAGQGEPLVWSADSNLSATWIPEAHDGSQIFLRSRVNGGEALYLSIQQDGATVLPIGDKNADQVSLAYFSTSDHTFDEIVVEPTCTRDGVVTRTCVACGATTSRSLAVLGHDWGPWTVTKKGTETDGGEEKRVCLRDPSHIETRTIPKAGESDNGSVVVTYNLAEGSIEGISDTFKVTYASGTEVKMLEAPTRAGYVFQYWESPHYRLDALDTFVAQSDESFTAIWAEEAEGADSLGAATGSEDSSEADNTPDALANEHAGIQTASTADHQDAAIIVALVLACAGIPLVVLGTSFKSDQRS
jgi:hypothetical protein